MGIFHILLGYGPTWSHPNKQDPLLLIFFNHIKAFPVLSLYKGFSYVTIPAPAETVSTDHRGVPFLYSLVNSAAGTALRGLWEGQRCHLGCRSALWRKAAASLSWSMRSRSCPGGIRRAVQNLPPGEQLSKLVKCFVTKQAGDQPSPWLHISLSNQTRPCLINAGTGWGVPDTTTPPPRGTSD